MPVVDPRALGALLAAAVGVAAAAQIRVGVALVTAAVTVRDARGHFVSDLAQRDFDVLEDGVSQDTVTFSLTHGGRVYNAAGSTPPARTDGILLPDPRPVKDASGRIIFIFVDDRHLEPSQTPRVRALFDTIARELIHPGDLFGIVSTGTSSIEVELISNSYDLNPFADTRANREAERSPEQNKDPTRQQTTFSEADLVSEISEVTRAAVRANVSIFTLDPRGLTAGPDISEPVDMVEYQKYVSKTQDTLRVLAEQTGGRAIVNRNDLTDSLKRIDAETSDYYMVGYYSSNPDASQRRRTIEIRVRRPGVSVLHRTEYWLKRQ
jgi:hypothetical protein